MGAFKTFASLFGWFSQGTIIHYWDTGSPMWFTETLIVLYLSTKFLPSAIMNQRSFSRSDTICNLYSAVLYAGFYICFLVPRKP